MNILKLFVVALVALFPMAVSAQKLTTAQSSISKSLNVKELREEEFLHTSVVLWKEKANGENEIVGEGIYHVVVGFDVNNNPVLLSYIFVVSTNDPLFARVPKNGIFKAETLAGDNVMMRFEDMLVRSFYDLSVEIDFAR